MPYQRKTPGTYYNPDTGKLYEIRNGTRCVHWSSQMIDDLRRLFPTTLNSEVAEYLGVSQRTAIRKAHELGIQKDPTWLANIWEERRQWAHMSARRKGFPGGFRKGHHANPEKEFKPGHTTTPEQRAKQVAAMREYYRTHKKACRERALKAWITRRARMAQQDNTPCT